ncbi:Isy1-like splicing family-domain-containing protein [Mycena galopus ATCC 62051]|nr:Isy1-like splicing family-domain-containing protein [Mycena galopus ATCC 62051]
MARNHENTQLIAAAQGERVQGLARVRAVAGELCREILRKVTTKIHDAGLSDYELRDVHDEINKQMRQKRHWENQIVPPGGDYRPARDIVLLDDDGKEVPGTKGCHLREKRLLIVALCVLAPSMRQLNLIVHLSRNTKPPDTPSLYSRKKDEEEHNAVLEFLKKFQNRALQYYSDGDEGRGVGVADKGGRVRPSLLALLSSVSSEYVRIKWQTAGTELRARFGFPEGAPIPWPAVVVQSTAEDQVTTRCRRAQTETPPPLPRAQRRPTAHITFLTPEMFMGLKLSTPRDGGRAAGDQEADASGGVFWGSESRREKLTPIIRPYIYSNTVCDVRCVVFPILVG